MECIFFGQLSLSNLDDWALIVPIGEFERLGRQINVTREMVEEMVANFGVVPPTPIPINKEHVPEAGAVGRVADLEVRDSGLWARFEWFQTGLKLLADKAFASFSPEIIWGPTDFDGKDGVKNILTGIALTNNPFFGENTTVFNISPPDTEMHGETEYFRQFSPEERRRLAKEGKALPDGSFPIVTVQDLRNAMQAIGRGGAPRAQIVNHIKKRARALIREGALSAERWREMTEGSEIFSLLEDDDMAVDENAVKRAVRSVFGDLFAKDGTQQQDPETFAALQAVQAKLDAVAAERDALAAAAQEARESAKHAERVETFSMQFREFEALNAKEELPRLLAAIAGNYPDEAERLAQEFKALAEQASNDLFGEKGVNSPGEPVSDHERYMALSSQYAEANGTDIGSAMEAIAMEHPDLYQAYTAHSRRSNRRDG